MMDYVQAGKDNLMNTYSQLPICFDHGSGCYLYDTDGNEYLDFVAGIAVNALGYGNEKLEKKAEEVIKEGIFHVSNLYYNKYTVEAAAKLNKAAGSDRVFFANSGAEANECALKLARKFGSASGRHKILSFEHSFHGRTYGAVTLTGQEKYHKGFFPIVPDVEYAIYNDIDSVESKLDEGFAAIFVEPIQGEGGIIPATAEFLSGLRRICDERDMLLIFDCVQCGCGRTGKLFAWQNYGIKPDVMTLAKALGGGIPLSATVAYGRAADILAPGEHASTFGGNPVASALCSVVLDELSGGLADEVAEKGEYLKNGLRKIAEKYPDKCGEVRGLGLMVGMELKVAPRTVIDKARDKGILLCSAGYTVLRFVPPLIISYEEIDKGLAAVDQVLSEI